MSEPALRWCLCATLAAPYAATGVQGDGSQQKGPLPADSGGSGASEATVLSNAVAREVGNVFAASENAAQAIRAKAQSDAELLVRGATREAAHQARLTVASVASEAVPQLEARVSELRALVAGVNEDIDRLTSNLNQLTEGTTAPALPAAGATAVPAPPVRTAEERRALLIALNMASNGASREEASRYLTEHLDVPDHERLLDVVYGYVGPDSAAG